MSKRVGILCASNARRTGTQNTPSKATTEHATNAMQNHELLFCGNLHHQLQVQTARR